METEDVPLVKKFLEKVDEIWVDIVKLTKSLGKMKRDYTIQSVEVLSAAAERAGAIGKAVFHEEPSVDMNETATDNTRELAELKSEVRSTVYKNLSFTLLDKFASKL